MQTLTMQAIADLAQVKRPVVSVWRARHAASSETPFPEPTNDDPLLFDAAQVTEWLVATGRGNNPEAGLESPLHSSAFRRIAEESDRSSALLLLHHVLGEPVRGLEPSRATAHLEALQLSSIVDVDTLTAALGDGSLCSAVDELAEAAFSGARVLDRMVEDFAAVDGPWAGEALTSHAEQLLGGVVAELLRAFPSVVVPEGTGGLVLAGALSRQLHERERPSLVVRPELLAGPDGRTAWRRLAAHGFPIVAVADESTDAIGAEGRLYLLMQQSVQSRDDFVDRIEQRLLELADDDLFVVVGPSRVLTDREGHRDRVRLLAPSADYAAPLRYVARLPEGLSRFGGQRRLALWVLGRSGARWTVVGDHAAARDAAAGSAISADVPAAVSVPADTLAHAFRASWVRDTRRLVRQPDLLSGSPSTGPATSGGERLARIWALRDTLSAAPPPGPLDGVDLAARDSPDPNVVSLAQAVPRLARDLSGARIGPEHLGPADAGSARVIGPDEVRDATTIGRRGIDRLTLESVAPRARLTEPGDVVYVVTGGPAAIVDEHGGHVVLAPARIVRCRSDAAGGRRLVAPVVAADIASQSATDRRSLRLRTVRSEQSDELSVLAARVADRRQLLLRELRTLDDLERELVAGLADGALNASVRSCPSTTTPKAAR